MGRVLVACVGRGRPRCRGGLLGSGRARSAAVSAGVSAGVLGGAAVVVGLGRRPRRGSRPPRRPACDRARAGAVVTLGGGAPGTAGVAPRSRPVLRGGAPGRAGGVRGASWRGSVGGLRGASCGCGALGGFLAPASPALVAGGGSRPAPRSRGGAPGRRRPGGVVGDGLLGGCLSWPGPSWRPASWPGPSWRLPASRGPSAPAVPRWRRRPAPAVAGGGRSSLGCHRAWGAPRPAPRRRPVRRRGPGNQDRRRKAFGGGDTLRGGVTGPVRHLPRSPARGAGPSAWIAVTDPAGPRRGLATTCPHCAGPRCGPARTSSGRSRGGLAGSRPEPSIAHVDPASIAHRSATGSVDGRSGSPTAPSARQRPLREAGQQRRRRRRRSPATLARPARTSSGRTAGTAWRSTRSRRAPGPVGLGREASEHGGPAVELAQALLGHPLHLTDSAARNASHRGAGPLGVGVSVDAPAAGLEQVGQRRRRATRRPPRRPGRRAAPRPGRVHVGGVHDLGEPDLEVLRLAGGPGGRGAGVGDPRVRVEARGVGHRHPGPEHGPLEGAAEVAVAGEPQPAPLGVADPQPLHRRRLLLGLLRPRRRSPAQASSSAASLIAGDG